MPTTIDEPSGMITLDNPDRVLLIASFHHWIDHGKYAPAEILDAIDPVRFDSGITPEMAALAERVMADRTLVYNRRELYEMRAALGYYRLMILKTPRGQRDRTDDLRELLAAAAIPQHAVSACCRGERCRICRREATHKVSEEFFDDDLEPIRVPLAAYVCCPCFTKLMGPSTPCAHPPRPMEEKETLHVD